MEDPKIILRRHFKTLRTQLNSDWINAASQQIAEIILKTNLLKEAKNIAYYIAYHHEVDPRPLMLALSETSSYLPVIDPKEKKLSFYCYKKGDPLIKNPFQIEEPVTSLT